MHGKEFSMITLTPRNEEELAAFTQFRNADVAKMLKYQCIIGTTFLVGYSISNISSQDWNDFSRWLWTVFQVVLSWTIWVLGKRFKDNTVYLIVAYYVITLLTTPLFAEKKEMPETPLLMLRAMFNQVVFFSAFLSPSYHYPVFLYIPGFLILLAQTMMRHFDEEDEVKE